MMNVFCKVLGIKTTRRGLCVLCFLFLVSFQSAALAIEPENLTYAKQKLVLYHDSGEYDHDINSTVCKAYDYLQTRILQDAGQTNNTKYAIVFDVDDTAVSQYYFMKENDFTSSLSVLELRKNRTDFPAIKEVLDLYNFVKQNNIEVFFISTRKESWRNTTTKLLHQAGYKNWQHLFLQNDNDRHTGPEFKTAARKAITSMGYDIILNVGDQYTDFAGGFADYIVKLPNPYYIAYIKS